MDYSPPTYNSPTFNTSLFLSDGGGYLTLVEGDARYLRLAGGTVRGYALFNGGISVTGNLVLNGQTVTSILTQTQGDARYLQLTGGSLSGALSVNRGNGETLISTNGIVSAAIHIQASTAHIGTTSNHTFNLQANNVNVLQCLNTGNVNVVNSLTIAGAGIAIGNNVSSITSDINIMESSATPQIEIGRSQTSGNSFNIGYTHVGDANITNRLFIQPRGASVNDTLTYTANGRIGIGSPTPTQKLEVMGNINISSGSSYMIGGTSLDSRYVQLGGATMTSQLYINGSASTSVPANRRYGSAGTDPSNQGGGTVPVSLRTSSNIWTAGDMYSSSDKRLKDNIVYPELNGEALLELKPAFYTWRRREAQRQGRGSGEKCFGLIAQDVIGNGLDILVNTFADESIDEPCVESNTPAGFCHTVEYNKIPLLLIDLCRKQQKQIDELNKFMNRLKKKL